MADLDGRGNLSEKVLLEWVDYFLDLCQDQVQFMDKMLGTSVIDERIRACIAFEASANGSAIRLEAVLPMQVLFLKGSLERGEFKRLLGLPARSADRVLQALLARRLLSSDSAKGKLRFGLPMHALRFYFPALWPEAEAG